MRDIRARIAQRHGIELPTQQIHELAARRLESILDPRTIRPALLDELRRAAGVPVESATPSAPAGQYVFDDSTMYESPNGALRLIRRLLHPVLKLFFNPTPLVQALHQQARINADALARETERSSRQTEWNALHYTILQKAVTEVSRLSLELQSLSLRVESLGAKVDFNERRVREVEAIKHQARPVGRAPESGQAAAAPVAVEGVSAADGGQSADSAPRRRRRRRGRRSGPATTDVSAGGSGHDGMPDADERIDDRPAASGAPELAGAEPSARPARPLPPGDKPAAPAVFPGGTDDEPRDR